MSFKKLEQRFTETSGEIYTKFGNTGAVSPILPDSAQSRSNIKNDDRAIPTISLVRDTSFVSAILKSDRGKLFLAKQLLLQTGNTFVDTRLYNPISFNLNLPPHIHLVRHVGRPIYNLLTPNRQFRGAIQKDTIKSFEQAKGLAKIGRAIGSALSNLAISPIAGLLYEPERTKYFGDGSSPIEFYKRPEDVYFWSDREKVFSPFLASRQELTQRGTKKTVTVSPEKKDLTLSKQISNFINTATKIKQRTDEPTGESIKDKNTFRKLEKQGSTNGYFQGVNYTLADGNSIAQNGTDSQILLPISLPTSSSIKDPYNLADFNTPQESNTDIISFVFSTVNPSSRAQEYVHFRAFINSFKQNVKTEFSEQRYLGRTERFVSYGGAKRTATLSFNIVAFSADEIQNMWNRVNYLTGLAFPLGVSNGFMIPPLFRLTVGGIYVDQPVYIDTLEHEFISEEFTPFDIDMGVSQCVTVNMGITLLEKKSRFYNSPFYAIAE